SQIGFEFAERQLNWIEVWRVCRQILNSRTASLDRLLNASYFLHSTVVHHNDVTRLEGRPQDLLDISQECWPVHGSLHHHRCRHSIMAQAGNEGDGFPVSLRNRTDQPLATRAAAPDTDHIRGDRRLVDKDQPRRIKGALLLNPTSARLRYVFSMSLGCTKAFFYR